MAVELEKLTVTEETGTKSVRLADPPRSALAEWTVTIILLLFGVTTLVQAYVIPTGSMEGTLRVGDPIHR